MQGSGFLIPRNRHRKSKINKIAEEISLKVLGNYGFKPKILILDLADFHNAIAINPFETKDGKALHFYFLYSQPDSPDLDQLFAIKADTEELIDVREFGGKKQPVWPLLDNGQMKTDFPLLTYGSNRCHSSNRWL